MGKKIAFLAILILALHLAPAPGDQQPMPNPFGPGVEVQPAPAPGEPQPQPQPQPPPEPPVQPQPQPQPPATQPSPPPPPAQPAPVSENTRKANELIKQGIAMLGKKRYAEAIKLFEEAEKLDPNIAEAPFGIGMANMGLNKPNDAIVAFERAKKIKPDEGNIHFRLAQAYMETGNTGKAIENYVEAVKLLKKDADREKARDALIDVYIEVENWEKALIELEESIKANSMVAKRYVQRGDVFFKMGKLDEAEADYKKALELFPGTGGAILGLARIKMARGLAQEALVAAEPLVKKYPDDPAVHLVYGRALIKAGKPKEGAAEIETAVKLGSKSMLVLMEAAQVLVEAKMLDRAVQVLNVAAELNPKSTKPHEMLEKVYLEMGKNEEAAAEREKIKILNSQNQ